MTFDPTDGWQSAVSTEEGDEEPSWRHRPAEDQHLHRALLPLRGGECVSKRDQCAALWSLIVLIRLDSRLNIWAWCELNIESRIESGLFLVFGSYEPTTEGNIWPNLT